MAFVDDAISLTPRERDIMALVAERQSSKGIARTMNLSHRTVERHVENCRFKLNARNKAELVAKRSQRVSSVSALTTNRRSLVELRGPPCFDTRT
jgi:DNA-binding CsgD family transcriptional regulator